MKTETVTFSRTNAVIKCCFIVLVIAAVISIGGRTGAQEFIHNLLEWQSI